jgi:hypothetical protein
MLLVSLHAYDNIGQLGYRLGPSEFTQADLCAVFVCLTL